MADIEHILTSGQSLSLGQRGGSLSTVSEQANAKQVNADGTLSALQIASGERQRPDLSLGYRVAAANPALTVACSTHGLGGNSIRDLSPGGASGKYEEAIAYVQSAHDVAVGAGDTYRVRALHWIQGERDENLGTSRAAWLASLESLHAAYRADVAAITGQTGGFPMIVGQIGSWDYYDDEATIPLAQVTAHDTLTGAHLAAPQYQLAYSSDLLHLNAFGYYRLGELHARAHNTILSGGTWHPVMPVDGAAIVDGGVLIPMHVPTPPLVFDTTLLAAQPDYGFSLYGTAATITGVTIVDGTSVLLSTDQQVTEMGSEVGYAVTGSRYGNVHDSDPTLSGHDGTAIPNWLVQFRDSLLGDPPPPPAPGVLYVLTGAMAFGLTVDGRLRQVGPLTLP